MKGIFNNRGFIRIRFRYNGRDYTLSNFGEYEDLDALRRAEMCKQDIDRDIRLKRFTASNNTELEAIYNPVSSLATHAAIINSVVPKDTKPDLLGVWTEFIKYRLKGLSLASKDKYTVLTKHIERLKLSRLNWDSLKIRSKVTKSLSEYQSASLLSKLSACCLWAYRHKLVDSNYFEFLATDLPSGRNQPTPKPFTHTQKELILQAFHSHKTYSHYYPFVSFLFETGCRTCEAVGLIWENVDLTNKQVTIGRSVNELGNGLISVRETSKNGKTRVIPMNIMVQYALDKVHASSCKPSDFVFKASEGNSHISARNFRARAWKAILTELGLDPKVYTPYSTRDTFITMALDKGVPDRIIAKLCDNSPEMIHKHYAGWIKEIEAINF